MTIDTQLVRTKADHPLERKRFFICLGLAFGGWTVWSILMAYVGEPFDWPTIRIIARVGMVALPAVYFLTRTDSAQGSPDRFSIKTNWKTGVIYGTAASLLVVIAKFNSFRWPPLTVHAWLNVILFSPIAEELLFRLVAIGYLSRTMGKVRAVLLSAFMFWLFHIPWFLVSGEKEWSEVFSPVLFVYGLIFGFLYVRTRSIWASLIPHWVNNFATIG